MSEEPLGLDGPNLYEFARGNPVLFLDLNGLESDPFEGLAEFRQPNVLQQAYDKYEEYLPLAEATGELAATIIAVNIPGPEDALALGGLKAAGKAAELIKNIDKSKITMSCGTFRDNLGTFIGKALKKGVEEAHHVIPKKFATIVSNRYGINVHSPLNGLVLDKPIHRLGHWYYNYRIEKYLDKYPNATKEEFLEFVRDLASKHFGVPESEFLF